MTWLSDYTLVAALHVWGCCREGRRGGGDHAGMCYAVRPVGLQAMLLVCAHLRGTSSLSRSSEGRPAHDLAVRLQTGSCSTCTVCCCIILLMLALFGNRLVTLHSTHRVGLSISTGDLYILLWM